jgi:hypothetical protein
MGPFELIRTQNDFRSTSARTRSIKRRWAGTKASGNS